MAAERAGHAVAWSLLLWVIATGLCNGAASAQGSTAAAPDTRDMIEALKPARQRNLLVRPSAAPVASAPMAAVAAPAAPPPQAAPALNAATLPAPSASASASLPLAALALVAQTPASLSLAIQFDLNSARVRPESGAVLGNLVAAMLSAELRDNRFLIEGHTDARGNPAANKVLSQQRADEVRLFLVALGVHPARLRAVGKGSSEPANPLDPLAGDNRRVRVVTLE